MWPSVSRRYALAMAGPSDILDRSIDEDPWSAVESVVAPPVPPLVAAERLLDAARHAYWDHRDLARTRHFAQAAAQHALTAATAADATPPAPATDDAERPAAEPDPAAAAEALRSIAKAALHDLASFTWPGWNQDGICPDAADRAAGRAAAAAHLRLTRTLARDDLALARAHRLLGMHRLAADRSDDRARAAGSFARAEAHAEAGGHGAEAALSAGLRALADLCEPGAKSGAVDRFNAAVTRLREAEKGGAALADQLETARRRFVPAGGTWRGEVRPRPPR